MSSKKIDFAKQGGLIPAVVQDADYGTVLMVGFMNQEALDQTLADRQVVFFSRTKNRLWKKGETSGHFLDLVSHVIDCDDDTILIKARPRGPVCHTGELTCFKSEPATMLDRLEHVIAGRKASPDAKSYTSSLFKEGISRIAQKVGEEGVEIAIAAQYGDLGRITEESADMLFHLLVLLAEKGIPLRAVYAELEKRHRPKP